MELTREIETEVRPEEALRHSGLWLTSAGYRVEPVGVSRLRFQRGSRWRTYMAMSPRSWFVTGTVSVTEGEGGGSAVSWFLDLDEKKTGQWVTPGERAFWEAEADALADAVNTGVLRQPGPAVAAQVARQNIRAILASLVAAGIGGAILGVAIALAVAVFIPQSARGWVPILAGLAGGLVGILVGWWVAARMLGLRWPPWG